MQSGSEPSGIQENDYQHPRGSFYVEGNITTSTIRADTPASAACLAIAILISSEGRKTPFTHVKEPVRLKEIAAGSR